MKSEAVDLPVIADVLANPVLADSAGGPHPFISNVQYCSDLSWNRV
jgi:hypothetical protein